MVIAAVPLVVGGLSLAIAADPGLRLKIETGEPLLIRRTLKADGGSRAFLNDQPCSAALLREVGTTAIFVTHDQDEAFELADRIAILKL